MDYADANQAEWALQDPSTPGEALAAIAQAHPALRDRVVTHPNAYPQLVTWIAAQATSAASGSPSSQSAGPVQQQSYGSAQPPYGQGQAYPAQPGQGQYPMQPGQGQPYPGQGQYPMQPGQGQPYQGYPAGPPAKKKTGLILGLVGGGVVVVLAVVAVLGLFVFNWFGGSSGSGPTLTKDQAKAFLDSGFMHDHSGDLSADDYSHSGYDASDLEGEDIPSNCQSVVDMMVDGDNWYSYSYASSVSVQRLPKSVSPETLMDASTKCTEFDLTQEDIDSVSIHTLDGGWWMTTGDSSISVVYGNMWVNLPDVSEDEVEDVFKDFKAAVDAAAK